MPASPVVGSARTLALPTQIATGGSAARGLRGGHLPAAILVIALAAVFALPTGILGPAQAAHVAGSGGPSGSLPSVGWVALPGGAPVPTGARSLGAAPAGLRVDLVLVLPSRDPSGLSSLLASDAQATPRAPATYLTASEFDARYGADPATVQRVVSYLRGEGIHVTQVYPSGELLDAQAQPAAIARAFHTTLGLYHLSDGRTVYAPESPAALPRTLASSVVAVEGLSDVVHLTPSWVWGQNTFQQGVQQQFFGPDLQVPNNLPAVYNGTPGGYGHGETVATILWDGQRCSTFNPLTGACSAWAGEVGPFDPTWVTTYWNDYLPSWEPRPLVAGVPVDGAVAPGATAAYDASGAYAESSLDVEVAGSMAPGANITEVYTTCDPSSSGPSGPTIAQIDDAFATAVQNPGGLASLKNVAVISNSWGAPEYTNDQAGGYYVYDSAWRTTLQQALAEGISVLASSGDSGNASVNWPADIGNATYGMVSVGGANLDVTGTVATQAPSYGSLFGTPIVGIYNLPQSNAGSSVYGIQQQQVWWFPAGTVNGQSYAMGGSTGGPSQYYAEPYWQRFALAGNSQDPNPWRGDADIAGVANNTLIELNPNGLTQTLMNTSYLLSISGTSVASPEDAGVLAVVAGALGHPLGYLDPVLYSLGYNVTHGSLPADPFHDVTVGQNGNYPAQAGWDYPTGWGTLNASGLLADLSSGIKFPLSASATATPLSGLAPLPVVFNGSASGGTAPYTWTWTFGDGTTGSVRNPSHTYAAPGTYPVQLTVVDAASGQAHAYLNVTATGPLTAKITETPSSGTAPLTVVFSSTVSGGTAPYTYLWSFGDGASSLYAQPTHTYNASGTFAPTLAVTDSVGHVLTNALSVTVVGPLSARASASSLTGAAPLTVAFNGTATGGLPPYTFSWSFGDGGTSSLRNPSHTYGSSGRFPVDLTVVDAMGSSASSHLNVTVTGAPTPLSVTATATPTGGNAPLWVNFTDQVTGGTAPYTWLWNFGDGTTGTQNAPMHRYGSAGTFPVELTITDQAAAHAYAYLNVSVSPSGTPLGATLVANVTQGPAPLVVGFSAQVTGGTAPFGYLWTFGGASTATTVTVTQTYSTAGTYLVELQVTDGSGSTITQWTNITVVPGGALEDFVAAHPLGLTIGANVTIDARAQGGKGSYAFSWWKLPTGCSGSASPTVACVPTATGTFPIEVEVEDSAGHVAFAWTNLTVSPKSGPGGATGLSALGLPWWVLALVIAAVVGAIVALLLLHRRRKKAEAVPGPSMDEIAPSPFPAATYVPAPSQAPPPPAPAPAPAPAPDVPPTS